MRLGYVGQNLSLGITTGSGTVLRNATPERLRLLIGQNLQALGQILEFNAQHGILFFRISSRVIPFASHSANRLRWWEEFARELAELGRFVQQHGMRVGMHPGQHDVLNSPDPEVVAATVADLRWHVRFLDSMGLGPEHKLVIHGGGVYGDKGEASGRFVTNYLALPETVRQRLVLENDERLYNVEEVLAISRRSGLPVAMDILHHRANPPGAVELRPLLEACFATWREFDGPPEIHFSSQATARRLGAHADYLDPEEFLDFYRQVSDLDFDCMLEAKAKDLALLRLRAQLVGLLPVE